MGQQPSGAVTFLFTDVVGSTRLWADDQQAMSASLEMHDDLLRETIERHGGYIFTTAGDAFCASFARSVDAERAAFGMQRRLADLDWPGPRLHVRVGLHTGDAELRGGDYFGPTVNVAARVAAAAQGDQVLATSDVAPSAAGFPVIDLGVHRLDGVVGDVQLYQLGDGSFPALDSGPGLSLFEFDGFTIDLASRELRSDGERLHVEPQVFDLLLCLVENRDRVVSREELLDEVWGDQFVSLSALTTRIKSVRQALGDDGRTQRYVRTSHGHGYRFVGEIERVDATPARPPANLAPGDLTSGLPEPLDPILGREREAADLERMLERARLVTLTGPGGMGKTRLSVDVARRWADASPGRSASFVALDEVRVADDLAAAVATSFGIDATASGDVTEACADWLATGERLVVLDNCEHLLETVSAFTAALLGHGGSAVVLATSREPLRLPEERLYRLGPLALPADGNVDESEFGPCIQLFIDRARRVVDDFDVTPENASLVVGLCSRLDGMPLAVELAASRLGSLGLAELAETLAERLDAIHASQQVADARHQNLRSTIEWSYRSLPTEACSLFDAMSRFPGGLRLSDAASLAQQLDIGASADEMLSQLVDASMLYTTESSGSRRYRMLETLRHFGNEQLAGDVAIAAAVDDALREHARGLAVGERAAWMSGVSSPGSNRRLREEIPNLRAARDVMLERDDPSSLITLSIELMLFTEQACLGEPWAWHDEISRLRPGLAGVDAINAELVACAADRNAGRLEIALTSAAKVIDATDDTWTEALAWHQTAMCRLFGGQMHEAVAAWDRFDELSGLLIGRVFGAMCLGYVGELDEAELRLDGCHEVLDGGHPYVVAAYHYVAGELARLAGSPTSRESFERGVATCLEHDLIFTLGICRVSLGSMLAAEGETARAAATYIEMIEQWLRAGAWPQQWVTLRNAAELLVESHPSTSLLIWAVADVDAQATAIDGDAADHIAKLRAQCREQCGDDEADLVERSARRISRRDVVARTLSALADLV